MFRMQILFMIWKKELLIFVSLVRCDLCILMWVNVYAIQVFQVKCVSKCKTELKLLVVFTSEF